MSKDVIYQQAKPPVHDLTAGQVRTAIRKFRDYSQDLQYADMNTFEDRVQMFVNFCQKDPVFSRIRAQLVGNPHVNFEEWFKHSLTTGGGMAGSCDLIFPVEEEDRLALMYQFVEAAGDPKYDVIGHTIYWFAVGSSRIDDHIRAFSDAVMRPLFRELGYKLDDVEAQLPDDRSARVSPAMLQIIHVERAEVRVETNQRFEFNESKNIQVGDRNTQDNRETDLKITLQEIIQRIDQSDKSVGEKREAKNLLNKFLEHPLVCAVVGGAIGAFLTPK